MRHIYKLFLFTLLLTTASLLQAQPVIRFTDSTAGSYIGTSVSMLQDSTNQLTAAGLQHADHLFLPNKKEVPDFGVTANNNWVRFRVVNLSQQDHIILSLTYPPIDQVACYMSLSGSGQAAQESTMAALNRDITHQYPLFKLHVPKGDTATCLLRLKSNKQLIVPMSLETEQGIIRELTLTDAFSGLYIGIMIVMILYNLFIYFSVKDKQYLYYVNYIFWVALVQAALLGYIQRFLLTEDTWLSRNIFTLSGALSGIGAVLFVKYFLNTKSYTPKSNFVLNVIIAADLLAILLLFTGYALVSYQIVNIVAALGAVTIFITAIQIHKRNRKPASFFLLAWNIFLFSVLVFVLKDFDVFPYNFFTVHSVQIGSAIEAILLSFALADRINILKKEKDESRQAALQVARENSRIIKEQNVILESKVRTRTEELLQKNETINNTLNDLKQTQSQLVEYEKMASLGQLTAGIAHEINNPINFVASNIAPLKRDVDVLLDFINRLETLNFSDIPESDKREEINLFKEEQDFDYLKMEIGHLLKGITEGASRTAEIIKSLRIFSRLDEDDLKPADLNEGLESTVVILNSSLVHLRVIKQYGNIPVINCYPGKLNQIFLNIISNAIYAINEKFGTGPGGMVTLTTYKQEQYVYVVIEDNGTGMTEETQKKIFEPFYTTKDVGQGTGLGMSIAFNIILKHNGHIQVRSEIGKGSSFTIQIPDNLN